MRQFLLFILFLSFSQFMFADDDIMITRDGEEREVKIDRITVKEVVFTDLKKKKRGKQSLPTNFVYLIKTDKRGNIFFDEEGNQITRPKKKIDKKDEVVYLTSCDEVVAYQLSILKDVITYKEADKKKAPVITKKKSEVFMIRHSDMSKDLFTGVKTNPQKLTTMPTSTNAPSTQPVTSPPPTSTPPAPTTTHVEKPITQTTAQVGAASFNAATDLDARTIFEKVYQANPYVLHHKGATAEYAARQGDKDVPIFGIGGPTYLLLTVKDERAEKGLIKVFQSYTPLNKQHEMSKGISAKFKETQYTTEIDTSGTFHLTNDIIHDMMITTKRQGYAALIPGNVTGDVKTHSILTSTKNGLGGTNKVLVDYTNMHYVGEEQVTTPAGTFNCIKITGTIKEQTITGRNAKNDTYERKYTWWLAPNIGFVRIDMQSEYSLTSIISLKKKKDKEEITITYYLNKLAGI